MDFLYPINCVVGMERWVYVKKIIYEKNDLTIYVHPDMGYLLLDRVKYKNSVFSWIFDEKTWKCHFSMICTNWIEIPPTLIRCFFFLPFSEGLKSGFGVENQNQRTITCDTSFERYFKTLYEFLHEVSSKINVHPSNMGI